MVSGTCRLYVCARYKCAEKRCEKRVMRSRFLEPIFDHKSINNRFTNSSKKRSPTNMEFYTKGVPKWSHNRYQNSSKINAKTGNGKDQENHQTSCFSEW